MITDEYFWETQRMLSGEFSKYILSHPEAEEDIPNGAEIVFQIRGDAPFNKLAKETAAKLHETGRPIIIVDIDGILPPVESRLINPHIETAASL